MLLDCTCGVHRQLRITISYAFKLDSAIHCHVPRSPSRNNSIDTQVWRRNILDLGDPSHRNHRSPPSGKQSVKITIIPQTTHHCRNVAITNSHNSPGASNNHSDQESYPVGCFQPYGMSLTHSQNSKHNLKTPRLWQSGSDLHSCAYVIP